MPCRVYVQLVLISFFYLLKINLSLAYSPTSATATHYLLFQQIQIGFIFLVLPFW